jgi:uncharacterized membrane protein YfcA
MEAYVQYATSQQLPTLITISLILGLGKGGVPGLATIATAATVLTAPTHLTNGLGFAVALMVPILTMIDIYAAYLHRNALDWTTIWVLLPLSFVGMILGQYVAEQYLSEKRARIMVGIILLAILALRTWKDVASHLFPSWAIEHHISGDYDKGKESDDEDEPLIDKHFDAMESGDSSNHNGDNASPTSSAIKIKTSGQRNISTTRRKVSINPTKRLVWACVVGLIGGMATMLTNSMGPILNVYLLSVAELTPSSYVGTRAMFFCFINVGKLPLRVIGGTLGFPMLYLALGLGMVSVLGVLLAKPIMLSINERLFVKLELGIVLFAGLRLCYMGIMN